MTQPAGITQTVSTAWVEALPVGTALQLTTDYDRTVLALKISAHPSSGGDIWHATDGRTMTAFGISMERPVLLERVPEPTTFTTPDDLRTWLHESDIVEPFSHFLRDAHQRPWIVTWSVDDPFVVSYPEGDDNGQMPAPSTYLGDLNLPAYPVRLIQETGA